MGKRLPRAETFVILTLPLSHKRNAERHTRNRGTMAVNLLDTWYVRLTTWYSSKPWYIRLACIGLTVVIVILFLVRFVVKSMPETQPTSAMVIPPANPTGANDVEEVTNAENTIAIKTKMIDQLRERNVSQNKFAQQAADITSAKNIGELHDLRKKFNL